MPHLNDTITSEVLQNKKSRTIQPVAPELTPIPSIESLNTNVSNLFQATPQEQKQSAAIKKAQQISDQLVGQQDFRKQQESKQKIDQKRQTFQDLSNQIAQIQAEQKQIPLQLQKQATGRGITTGGLQPLQTARLRTNAIRALSVSSQLEAARGNLSFALDLVDKAVATKFDPIREQLNAQLRNIELIRNDPATSRQEKTRAAQAQTVIQERSAIINKKQLNEELVGKIIAQAAGKQATSEELKILSDAKTPNEALQLMAQLGISERLTDKEKIDLKTAITNSRLKNLQLRKTQEELNIFRKFGGLSPVEYNKQLKQERKDREKSIKNIDKLKEDVRELDNSVTQIDAILNSGALSTVVGPSVFSRGIGRQKGFISSTLSLIPAIATAGFTSGILDEVSGSADDTVALTQQIIDQQFLDKLINVKSKGATFGALSDNEGQALRNAANAISNSSIKKDERVVGYDMSEKEFKNQLSIIQETMKIARRRASGEVFSKDEQDFFNSLNEQQFNPQF